MTASRLKACAKPLGPNLVQLTFVKIWQKSDESSKSAQMSKNRVSGPLIFIIPALWSSKNVHIFLNKNPLVGPLSKIIRALIWARKKTDDQPLFGKIL